MSEELKADYMQILCSCPFPQIEKTFYTQTSTEFNGQKTFESGARCVLCGYVVTEKQLAVDKFKKELIEKFGEERAFNFGQMSKEDREILDWIWGELIEVYLGKDSQ